MPDAQSAPLQPLQAVQVFGFQDVPRLTAALRRCDEAAFSWLHGEWSQRINRYCFALAAGDEALAHEIAQAAWLRLVRHARVMKDEAALWSWVALAARHAAADLRRKGGRYLRALHRYVEWWTGAASADACAEEEQLIHCLERALRQLSAEDAALVTARYFAGEPLLQIAECQGISVRAVEGRLARLRTRLRELIAKDLQSPT
jgi:RNA polymerase sigma factor (sigma-70 family)